MPTTILRSRMNVFQRKQYRRHKPIVIAAIKLTRARVERRALDPYFEFRYGEHRVKYRVYWFTFQGYNWVSLWDENRQFVVGVPWR